MADELDEGRAGGRWAIPPGPGEGALDDPIEDGPEAGALADLIEVERRVLAAIAEAEAEAEEEIARAEAELEGHASEDDRATREALDALRSELDAERARVLAEIAQRSAEVARRDRALDDATVEALAAFVARRIAEDDLEADADPEEPPRASSPHPKTTDEPTS